MKKIYILLAIVLLTASCTKKDNLSQTEEIKQTTEVKQKLANNQEKKQEIPKQLIQEPEKTIEEQIGEVKLPGEEYGDLATFIKVDLADEEKQAILQILQQRKQRQIEINNIIDKAVEEGNFKEKFEKIKQMRSVCASRILPYVYEDKKEKFLKVCENGNIRLQALYLAKMRKKSNPTAVNTKVDEEKAKQKKDALIKKIKELNAKKIK